MTKDEFIGICLRDYAGARLDKHKLTSILTRFEQQCCGVQAEPSEVRALSDAKQKNSDLELQIMGLKQTISKARDNLAPYDEAADTPIRVAWELLDSVVPSDSQS